MLFRSERDNTVTKYYIVFASHHKDAMILMNDIMVKAYASGIHDATYTDLWAGVEDWTWRDARKVSGLDQVILDAVQAHSGETRKFIWFRIVQAHFRCYLESEYRDAVQKLIDEEKLISPTPRPKKRLNDDCVLYLP